MGFRVKLAVLALMWGSGSGLSITSLGCGSIEYVSVAPMARPREDPTAPEPTASQLTACANEGAARLTETMYDIAVDVDVTESGAVHEARVRESSIPDHGMESCMVRALEAMPLPPSVMGRLASQSVAPQSRGYMGSALVLGGAVNLVPIVIVAAGVTILVAVTVHLTEETIEAIKRRRVEKLCYPRLYECLENRKQPEWNRETFGSNKDCGACFRECVKDNMWPNYKCPPPGYNPN